MISKLLISLCLIVLFGSCGSQKTATSVVEAINYDTEANKTTLTLVPYGNINIPGKWTKKSYNKISRQYFFVDEDSTLIAVTKNPDNVYPFYSENLTEIKFVEAFFNWEKDYYTEQGYQINKISQKSNFIIWSAISKSVNTIFLYGIKNGIVYNFSVYTTNWNDQKRIEFLTNLFDNN